MNATSRCARTSIAYLERNWLNIGRDKSGQVTRAFYYVRALPVSLATFEAIK
jgi:hypothetical protein